MRKLVELLGQYDAVVPLAVSASQVIEVDLRGLRLLQTTGQLVLAVAALAMPTALILAWGLARRRLWAHALAERLLLGMIWAPLVVVAAGWQAGFGPEGWWTRQTTIGPRLAGIWGAAWIHAMAAVPWATWILATGIRQLEPDWEDAARLELSPAGVFFRVTLRRLVPWLSAALAWIACSTATEITVTDLFQVRTFAEELYTELALGESLPGATLRLWPMAVLIVGTLGLVAVLVPRWAPRALVPAWQPPAPPPRSLGWSLAVWALVFVVVAVPVGDLIYRAGILVSNDGTTWHRRWSLLKLLQLIAQCPARYADEWGWTCLIGLLGAGLATLLALLVESRRWQRDGNLASLVLGLGLLLALPAPAIGQALIWAFNRPEIPGFTQLYDRSVVPSLLAVGLRALPLAWLVAFAGLHPLPRLLADAARLEGLRPLQVTLRVALPLARRSLVAALLLALSVATADVGASILVVPPGVTTVALRLFNLIHYGVEDQVAAICLVWLAVAVGAGSLATGLQRRPPS